MSRWRKMAYKLQLAALEELPDDATLTQKSNAIRDAWPKQLGERSRWPYKMWLIVRREMLGLPRIKTGKTRKKQLQEKKVLKKEGLVQGRLF